MSSTERNNLEKEVENAPTPLQDTANEIETTVKNTTQDVSETVTGILTPANIMVVLGFLGISESFRMDSCTGSSSRESLVHEIKKNKDIPIYADGTYI